MLIQPSLSRATRLARGGRSILADRSTFAALLAFVVLTGCDAADARDPNERPSDAVPPAADTLEAVTVDLGYTLGSPEAAIAVVEFSDFGCPYCARFARETMPSIRQELIAGGVVRWRYVPVTFGFQGGELMAAAAVCAADQGGGDVFWEVHDLFYARQVALRGDDARGRILPWLAELGVDPAALDACIDAPDTRALLDRHNAAAGEWYVRGTPTFIINGVPLSGAMPLGFFHRVFGTMLDPSGL